MCLWWLIIIMSFISLLLTFISCYKVLVIVTVVSCVTQACQADLASVIPSLHAAITSLDSLDKADISEIRWDKRVFAAFPQQLHLVSESCQCRWCRAQWFKGTALDSRLKGPGFESFDVVLKPWASFFIIHCASSLSCINEYLAIDNGGYLYEQPSRINCSIRLDASQRSWDGVWLNRSAREVKCKALWAIMKIGYCAI